VEEQLNDHAANAVILLLALAPEIAELERLQDQAKRLDFEPSVTVPATLLADAQSALDYVKSLVK
jgi:hypothetical protein